MEIGERESTGKKKVCPWYSRKNVIVGFLGVNSPLYLKSLFIPHSLGVPGLLVAFREAENRSCFFALLDFDGRS